MYSELSEIRAQSLWIQFLQQYSITIKTTTWSAKWAKPKSHESQFSLLNYCVLLAD